MKIDFKEKLINEFSSFRDKLNGQKLSKIHDIRLRAFEELKKLDVPNPKDEQWRFTNLNFLFNNDFNFQHDNPDKNLEFSDIEKFTIKDLDENLIVFVNGVYSEKLSRTRFQRDEIIIENFYAAEKRNAPKLVDNFSKLAGFENDFFTSLNTAFTQEGVYINIPAGVYVSEPIHLLFINDTRKGAVISNPRSMIVVGKCSQVKIVETYHTIGGNPAFTNMVSEFDVHFATNVELYKIQNDSGKSYYLGNSRIKQEKNSSFNSTVVTLNGNFVRNDIKSTLAEENSELNLYGFYYLKNSNFVDNRTVVEHAVPSCVSNEFYKGILDDNSRAVFSGRIVVQPDAQKTNAYQTNRNILLTDDAKIHTMPQLEIYADDVKCSHGATTGYFDKEHLFYLRARGVSEEMAKSLMLNAFASEIIEKIKIFSLRDEIKRQVAGRLTVDDIYFCDVLDDIFEKAGEKLG